MAFDHTTYNICHTRGHIFDEFNEFPHNYTGLHTYTQFNNIKMNVHNRQCIHKKVITQIN